MGHASLVETNILIRFHCRGNVQRASKAIRQRIMSLCIFKRVDYMNSFSRGNPQVSPWRKNNLAQNVLEIIYEFLPFFNFIPKLGGTPPDRFVV